MPSQKNLELIEVKTSTTEQAVEEISFREAILPPSIRELRQKLGQKAKQQKRFRFYSLYGLVCRRDVLEAAWAAVRRNDGAPGVDGVSIEQITAKPESEAAFLEDIQRSLQERTYRAQAVRRVYISKPNGKLRPLGIPTVRDRVVQAAVLLILEPIASSKHWQGRGVRCAGISCGDTSKTGRAKGRTGLRRRAGMARRRLRKS